MNGDKIKVLSGTKSGTSNDKSSSMGMRYSDNDGK